MLKVLLILLSFHWGFAHSTTTAVENEETASPNAQERIQKDLEAGFESLKIQVKNLQEKVKTSSGKAKKEMEGQLARLEKEQQEVQVKMEKMKTSSGKAWEDMKAGANEAYERFRKSVVQAKERFNSEEKPKSKKDE